MKAIGRNLISILLAAGGMLLLVCNAQAQLNMPEREHTQTIVWIVEAVTFVTTIAIALFVWNISKRDRNSKDRSESVDKGE